MIRHWLPGLEMTSQATRVGSRVRRGRRHWGPEGLEDRLLLSGPTAYTVNLLGDAGTETGTTGTTGDLRYVIKQANGDPNSDGSVISFDPNLFATPETIQLTSTLELSETGGPEVIDGHGTTGLVVIAGNGTFGDFLVHKDSVTATLSQLKITGGSNALNGGGSIDTEGNLTIDGCVIELNRAGGSGGAISNGGTMTITDSVIADNTSDIDGGGIFNAGTLTVSDSLIVGNSSTGNGGGIINYGDLTVTDSSLYGNSSAGNGGGIVNIKFNDSLLKISNSTIVSNSAESGGGIENVGTLMAVNDTIAYNEADADVSGGPAAGGGLDAGGSGTTLDNTIIALNLNDDHSPARPDDISGSVSSASAFNLIGTGGVGVLTDGEDGNQVGVIDPGLGTLGSYGGSPLAYLIPLLPGSPAIDAGNNALARDPATDQPLATDQRDAGFVRIFNGTVDVGAYELQPHLVAIAEPPTSVAAGTSFGMTVAIFEQSGPLDTGFNGNVTLALVKPDGAALGGTLTVTALNGVATFSGLTIDRGGTYRITASIDSGITTLTTPVAVAAPPTIVAVPPTIVTEKVLFAGKGKRRHAVGYELDFSAALDPVRAMSLADYELTQTLRHGRKLIAQPVAFRAAYDASARSVTLTLAGRPKFTKGGRLVVVAAPPGGLANAAGVALDGDNRGAPGDDGSFAITPKGTAISR